jgi:nucleoside triphosphate pyrophosphatase
LDFQEREIRVQGFRLILASGSPRRRELLAQAGFVFEVDAADVDETLRAGEDAADYVRRLAEEKALAVFARRSGEDLAERPLVVLGADTSVVCDGEVLGKPVDATDAERMLRRLSGRTHLVLTGVAAVTRAGVVGDVVTTEVTFSEIAESEIAAYCATGEPLDKAGGYGIQEYAARWVPRIDGCYFNVMGLPIARVVGLVESATTDLSRFPF